MRWYIAVLKKFAVFSGRASRTEYWMFYLVHALITTVLYVTDYRLGFRTGVNAPTYAGLSGLYTLAMLVPATALTVRRLHDTGRSGWSYFISLIPLVGLVLYFVYMVGDSQPNTNLYGPNPKGELPSAVTAYSSPPAGWWTDPTGRHERRYRDGRTWTSRVSDGEVIGEDPYQPPFGQQPL